MISLIQSLFFFFLNIHFPRMTSPPLTSFLRALEFLYSPFHFSTIRFSCVSVSLVFPFNLFLPPKDDTMWCSYSEPLCFSRSSFNFIFSLSPFALHLFFFHDLFFFFFFFFILISLCLLLLFTLSSLGSGQAFLSSFPLTERLTWESQ